LTVSAAQVGQNKIGINFTWILVCGFLVMFLQAVLLTTVLTPLALRAATCSTSSHTNPTSVTTILQKSPRRKAESTLSRWRKQRV